MKLKEKIKEKSIKLKCSYIRNYDSLSVISIAAFADVETDATSGVWASVATWITKNKNGLSIAAKALLGLCLVGVVICSVQAAKTAYPQSRAGLSLLAWLLPCSFSVTLS